MKRPAYKEYKKSLAEPGNLIRASALRSYIETTPYRFKYVQIVLFAIFTVIALLLAYMIPVRADKTGMDKTDILTWINVLKIIPLSYWSLVGFLLVSEYPLRYLFAGFKQVPEDYFQNESYTVSKTRHPSYMDILIESDFIRMAEQKNQKPRSLIYCSGGNVYEERRFRIYYAICAILRFILFISFPTVSLLISLALIRTDAPEYYLYSIFHATIALAVLFVFIIFIFPAIRWRFNRFEEVDVSEAIKAASEEKQ